MIRILCSIQSKNHANQSFCVSLKYKTVPYGLNNFLALSNFSVKGKHLLPVKNVITFKVDPLQHGLDLPKNGRKYIKCI